MQSGTFHIEHAADTGASTGDSQGESSSWIRDVQTLHQQYMAF